MKEKNTRKPNGRQGNKRIALLLVLKALEQMSDEQNPIRQASLAKMVNDVGGALNLAIWCDRKTIGRHIKLLIAAGYKIIFAKGKGYYLESDKFTKQESEILITMIKESVLTDGIKELMIDKLLAQQKNLNADTMKKNL
ncbi:hypothetical protein FACS1894211_16540 [Clostridia bacterium]|nr:hypothetical protein FACS1894211_16540 [Clostridia bacterium]